jgi:hypothetical protein
VKLSAWVSAGRPRIAAWLVGNSVRVVLFVAGSLLVLAAIYVVPERAALASTLTAAGTALVAFGALLPYIEGPFAFGPFRGKKVAPPTITKGAPPTTASDPEGVRRVDPEMPPPPAGSVSTSQEDGDDA